MRRMKETATKRTDDRLRKASSTLITPPPIVEPPAVPLLPSVLTTDWLP